MAADLAAAHAADSLAVVMRVVVSLDMPVVVAADTLAAVAVTGKSKQVRALVGKGPSASAGGLFCFSLRVGGTVTGGWHGLHRFPIIVP
jgi:hypothetical protein